MANRDLSPEQLKLGFDRFTSRGICPNTGDPCSRLGDLVFKRNVVRDSLGMALAHTIPESPRAQEAQTEYFETMDKIHAAEMIPLSDSDACLGGCALADVEIS